MRGATNEHKEFRAFGLITAQDDSKARTSAHILAREWHSLPAVEQQASSLALAYVCTVEQHFDKMLAQVYPDPTAARYAIDLAHVNAGMDETLRTLSQSPDRLGALRTTGTPLEVARLDWQTLANSARTAFDRSNRA